MRDVERVEMMPDRLMAPAIVEFATQVHLHAGDEARPSGPSLPQGLTGLLAAQGRGMPKYR
jgi:hypothetical protein